MATCSYNKGSVVGYWGSSTYQRVESENIAAKVKVLLIDKLNTRGKSVFLWQPPKLVAPICSCHKDTTKRSDTTCLSCYGTRIIPGYTKFAHETIYLASITSGASLVNTIIDTNIKPYRVLLNGTSLSGSITSPRLQYSNPLNLDWDFRIDAANIKGSISSLSLRSVELQNLW